MHFIQILHKGFFHKHSHIHFNPYSRTQWNATNKHLLMYVSPQGSFLFLAFSGRSELKESYSVAHLYLGSSLFTALPLNITF